MRAKLVIGALLLAAAACSKLRRDYVVDLGRAASAADQALSAYYERRQAIALNIPQETFDALAASVREELDGKKIAAPDAEKDKVDAKGPVRISHRLDDVSLTPCIRGISFVGTGKGKLEVEVVIESCGLRVEVGAGVVRIEPPPKGDSPVILTVHSLKLKHADMHDTLRFKLALALRQDGKLEILGAELTDGLRELTDPASIDVDVALSGAEAATGWLGKSVNEARTMLLETLFSAARAQVVLAIQKSLQRAVDTAAKRVTRASLVKGLSIKARGFEAKVAGRVSGLSGTQDGGLTLVASALLAFRGRTADGAALDELAPTRRCTIGHGAAPEANATWVGDLTELGLSGPVADAKVATNPSAAPPAGGLTAHGKVFLPFELLQHAAWLIAGERGDCAIPIVRGAPLGDLHVAWNAPVGLNAEPATHRNRPALKFTIRFKDLSLRLDQQFFQAFTDGGMPPAFQQELAKPVPVLQDFDYSFYAEIEPATAARPAQLYLAVEDQDRYAQVQGYDWKTILAATAESPEARASVAAFARGLARTLLDQTLGPLFGADEVAIANDASQKIALESLSLTPAGVVASFAGALDPVALPGTKAGLSLTNPARGDMVAAYRWLDKLQKLGFPALVGLPRAQADGFAGQNFLPAADGWTCTDERSAAIPAPDFSTVGVSYRRCVRAPDDAAELTWTSSSLGQEHDAARQDVIVAARLSVPAGGPPPLPVMSVQNLVAAIDAPPTALILPPAVQLSWSGDGLNVVATGFCKGEDAAQCNLADILAKDVLQLVELKAYVP